MSDTQWTYDENAGRVLDAHGISLALYVTKHSGQRMAAAPDMLAALMGAATMPWGYCICPPQMGDMEGKPDESHCGECRDVRAAIAKATGKQCTSPF